MSSVIPFLFVLAVVYGALEVSDIFKRKQVKLILSLCFAFVAMTTEFITEFIMGVLPYAIIAFIALFFIGFAMSFFKEDKEGKKGEKDFTLIAIVLVLFLLFAANYGLDFLDDMIPGMATGDFVTGLGLVVILIIFYSIYKMWNKTSKSN
jgi:uncharacterized membrane protein